MNKTISLLHTADVHVQTFDTLFAGYPVDLVHRIESVWLDQALAAGLTDSLVRDVSHFLRAQATKHDMVICTCSSLGPIVDRLHLKTVLRIDGPMMDQAVQSAPVLLTMCLPSTRESSCDLLEKAFTTGDIPIDYRVLVCEELWPLFVSGQLERFARGIAGAIQADISTHDQSGSVVLAQASMRGAGAYLQDIGVPVYSSPDLAVCKVLKQLNLIEPN